MGRLLYILPAALLGLLIGGWSALYMSGVIRSSAALSNSSLNIDDWTSDWTIGSAASGPYLRARVARHGLLALAKEEAVYFTRSTDSEGRPLRESCSYRLSGSDQPAQWWSITLYDEQSRLPMNEDEALSIDATTVGRAAEWEAEISRERQNAEHWVSSRNAGNFDLTLRLYRPSAELLANPKQTLSPPIIERLSCEGESE